MRAVAVLLLLCVCSGCPKGGTGVTTGASSTGGDADTSSAITWLDPQARVSRAVRLTSPGGIDVRQAAYWQPSEGEKQQPLAVLLRTRDYNKRVDGQPDPQRIAVLDLASGVTSKLDETIEGLPFEFAVSPNHRYAVVALLEALPKEEVKEGGAEETEVKPDDSPRYSQQAVNLRGYGYGDKPLELRPQPSVVPQLVLDNGEAVCRIVRAVLLQRGLPAVGIDWSKNAQLCNLNAKRFSNASLTPLPSADGALQAGYAIRYDPALPDKGRIKYRLGKAQSWELDYFAAGPFEWRPPLQWISPGSVVTVSFRRNALGGSAGLFRIVALERSGSARLIEERATSDVSLVSAAGVLIYTLRSGGEIWGLWAASPDGMQKQRVLLAEDTVFLEVLDIVDGRRVLLHRQYFGSDDALHSELLELSLDPLQPTQGKKAGAVEDEVLKPLPSSKAVVQESEPLEPPAAEVDSPEDLFPSGPGDDGGGFIPDNPGDGPPPIAEP